jgi:hypothetical protein
MPKLGRSGAGRKTDVFESTDNMCAMNRSHDSGQLSSAKFRRENRLVMPPLIELLITTRSVQCYDARDRIYAMLGICEDEDRAIVRPSYTPECTVETQYHALAAHYTTQD